MVTEKEFEDSIKKILSYVGEDIDREGLIKTPQRVRKAFEFMTKGYTQDPIEIINSALFNSSNDEMVIVKDIEFYSQCEHHILPIIGKAHIAYIPDGKVVGLSKIPRVVDVFARRLQIQEQMCEQIASAIDDAISPKGVAVVLDARHMCMEMRGVEKVCSSTVTTSLRGVFKQSRDAKKEFMDTIASSFKKS